MSAKRRGKLVPKTKIASNWLSVEEKTPKARKKDTYKCFCNKRYSSAAYLARHILKHHAPNNGVSTEDGAASQEGSKLDTTEILGPESNEVRTKNNIGAKSGEETVPSPQTGQGSKTTKTLKKKMKPKGRVRSGVTYKYRNRNKKIDGKSGSENPGNSRLKPKVELDVESSELVDCDQLMFPSEIGEEGDPSVDNLGLPPSVYDFNDASDDEGIDFKSEELDEDLSSKEDDSKPNLLDNSTVSVGTTSGISTTNSTPLKKRSTRTYQGGVMKRLHACHICAKTYSSVGKLKRHMRSHTEEGQKRLFTCGICQKSFNSNSVLIAHIRVHTGEKPFKCDECNMAFKQTSHLNRHKRVHSGEKPFTCEVCRKGFPHNFNLVIHRRKHTGEKPYVCNVCNHPFADRSNLNKHMPRCLKRLCEQIDVMGSLDDSIDEYSHERRRRNTSRVKSEFNQGDSDDNMFEDDMNFPVTYEQVITQTVEEAPGTSSYMDETPYHTPDEGSSFDMVGSAERSLGQSLIGQIEPSRMMREVDVTFVEGEPPEWDSVKRFRKRDAGKRGETYPDTSVTKKRARPKQTSHIQASKRQTPARRRSPKKNTKHLMDSHSVLPHNIFQDDAIEPATRATRSKETSHAESDFAILAEQILEDHIPLESDSNLTELLIPVDSGWMEHTKGIAKEIGVIQHDQSSHRRPPPVSELFKLRRPPEMDELSEPPEPTPPTYPSSSTAPEWSTAPIPSPLPLPSNNTIAPRTSQTINSTAEPTPHSLPTLSSQVQDKPTEYTSMEIEQPLHSPNTLLSPSSTRPVTSPCLGTEVEEVYAQYPDPSYDQGLEVNTKNIIISEPNRLY